MGEGNSQILESLAWEGLVDGPAALAIGIGLVLIAAWFLWRERQAVGRRWAAAFFVLRVIAFGIALWMLAGPTQLRIERTTTNQSVAIFADGSESMAIVDPPDAADAVRWALAVDDTTDDDALVRCDRLNVVLGAALANCRRFKEMVEEHRPTRQLENLLRLIDTGISRATKHAEALVSEIGNDEVDADRASRIASLLDGPVDESLAAIRSALSKADETVGEAFLVRIDQLVESVQSAQRRADVFAADLAQQQASNTANMNSVQQIDVLSRREKAGRTLDALEGRIAGPSDEHLRIDRFRFDRTSMPVSQETGWSQALESLPPVSSTDVAGGTDISSPVEATAQSAASGAATNLSAVFEQLAGQRAGQSTRLAIVLSDGRHNDVEAAPPHEVAAQLAGVPIYVVPIGNAVMQRDVLLHRVEAPSTVAEKDSAVIDVIITGFDCEGLSTVAVLRHEGREVERKPVEFTGNRSDYRVRFMVPAKELGWQEYIVEVESVEDETNTANNYQPVSFEVVREKIRVLLADGMARWEYRYLNQLFRREPHVEFDELLFNPRLQGSGRLANRPDFPRDVEGWAGYDVVILGDIGPGQIARDSQQALVDYVRTRGGNLFIIAGQNSMPGAFPSQPLMELLPVEPSKHVLPQQGYTLNLTEEGRFHSALLIADSAEQSRREWLRIYRRFPVYGLSEYSQPKSTARTLIEAVADSTGDVSEDSASAEVQNAFLCWHRVGAGRVAYLAAPDTYRLRFLRGDRMHHRFWGQFLRWITAANAGAGTDLVRLQTDRTRYADGEPIEVTVWLKDPAGRPLEGEAVQVEARTFNNELRSVELAPDADVAGRYFGTFSDLAAGAYQLGVRGKVVDELLKQSENTDEVKATITVTSTDSIEMLNTQCNRALLAHVAQMTGGQVIPPTAISEVLQLVSFTPEVSESVQRTPLWNRWSNLFLVLGCLFTEWIVRKAKGLV